MADRIVLLTLGDAATARHIIDEFAQRTGLRPQDVDGGAAFPLEGDDHQVQVVQTLTEIDPQWTDHLMVGDPEGAPG